MYVNHVIHKSSLAMLHLEKKSILKKKNRMRGNRKIQDTLKQLFF